MGWQRRVPDKLSTPAQCTLLKPRVALAHRVSVDYTGPGVGLGDLLFSECGPGSSSTTSPPASRKNFSQASLHHGTQPRLHPEQYLYPRRPPSCPKAHHIHRSDTLPRSPDTRRPQRPHSRPRSLSPSGGVWPNLTAGHSRRPAPIIGVQVWMVPEVLSLKRDVAQLQGKPQNSVLPFPSLTRRIPA